MRISQRNLVHLSSTQEVTESVTALDLWSGSSKLFIHLTAVWST